jgi:hypothetical protein
MNFDGLFSYAQMTGNLFVHCPCQHGFEYFSFPWRQQSQ